jgi:hypothetical protein
MDSVFPRLSGAMVGALNRKTFRFNCVQSVDEGLIQKSSLHNSILFEASSILVEGKVEGGEWGESATAIIAAADRLSAYFNAKPVPPFEDHDIQIVNTVAENLFGMLGNYAAQMGVNVINSRPRFRGFGWIASGVGDFAVGRTVIEVKNTAKPFSADDYRQLLVYWLLDYAASIEKGGPNYETYLLVNPRRNIAVQGSFSSLLDQAAGEKGKLEVYETFRARFASPGEGRK